MTNPPNINESCFQWSSYLCSPSGVLQKKIKPLLDKAIGRTNTTRLCKVAVEIAQIAAVVLFLSCAVNCLFSQNGRIPLSNIYKIIVSAPLKEELVFRGIPLFILPHIQLIAEKYAILCCGITKSNASTKEKQRAFRIQTSALLFALAHIYFNPHYQSLTVAKKGFQLTLTLISGIINGRLAEKYQSLAPGLLAHGLNNGALLFLLAHPQYKLFHSQIPINLYLPTAWLTNKVAFYLIGNSA